MRMGALLLLVCAAAFAQDEGVVRLSRRKPSLKVRRNYALPDESKAVAKPESRNAKIGKDAMFFFDVDGNGTFDDEHVDGWSLSGMPYMLPLEPEVVIGRSVFSFAFVEEGKKVQWRRTPIAMDPAQWKTLEVFNTWRMMNGLPAVKVDPALSKACVEHCRYMEKHGMTHVQEADNDGYTAEGAAAGLRSCLGQDGPRQSVHMFYASFYHRLPLIHPGKSAIGIGSSSRYTAIDGLTTRAPRAWKYPVIVPAPGSWFQLTHFARESPRPYPTELKPGFPITLTFDGGTITNAGGELRLKNAKGREIPTLLSSPEHPAVKKRPANRKTICLIPRVPLPPGKVYWVHVTYELDGKQQEHSWVFKTGRPGPLSAVRAARLK